MLKNYQNNTDTYGIKLGEALDRKVTAETLNSTKLNSESPMNILTSFKINIEARGSDQDSDQSADSRRSREDSFYSAPAPRKQNPFYETSSSGESANNSPEVNGKDKETKEDGINSAASLKKIVPYPKSQFFQKRNSSFINTPSHLRKKGGSDSDDDSDEESFDPNFMKMTPDHKYKVFDKILEDENIGDEPDSATKKRNSERHSRRMTAPLDFIPAFTTQANEPNIKTPETLSMTQVAKEMLRLKIQMDKKNQTSQLYKLIMDTSQKLKEPELHKKGILQIISSFLNFLAIEKIREDSMIKLKALNSAIDDQKAKDFAKSFLNLLEVRIYFYQIIT